MEKIIWAGFSMALFAAILNVTKKQLSVSDKLLSAWLFLLAIDFGNLGILSLTTDYSLIPSSFFLFNPALFLYARSLTKPAFTLKWRQLLHLLPYIFFELSKIFIPITLNSESFFVFDHNLWLRVLFTTAFIASLIAYNALSILMVHKHRLNLKNEFSNITDNQRIAWLLYLIIAYNIYVFSVSLWGLWGFISSDFEATKTYNYLASMALTFSLGFYGIRQEEIYKRRQKRTKPESEPIAEPEDVVVRYSQSNLSEDRKLQIKQAIIRFFNEEKPYLKSELNMLMLSQVLVVPKHQLTEVLNTQIGSNFFQFVNEYRVQAVKEKLADHKNDDYSIEAIGYECGFSSKSSFFSVFKLVAGQTPLQYRKSVR